MTTDLVSEVYEDLLRVLVLEPQHHKQLKQRGFTDDQIVQGGYKTLPRSTKSISDKLADKWGDKLDGVAGFCKRDGKDWIINTSEALLIPMRNGHGEITGIKVRGDKASNAKKYVMLSSAKADGQQSPDTHGTKASPECHFPTFAEGKEEGVLRITEGELKADLATIQGDIITVSIPGVLSWKQALPLVRDLKPTKVLLAFDSDKDRETASSTPDATDDYAVGKCLSKLYKALKEEGFNVVIEDWPAGCGKGVDDVYINGYEDSIVELTQEQANDFIGEKLEDESMGDYVYIIGLKRFVEVSTGNQYDKEQFDDKLASVTEEKGKPSTNFIKDPSSPLYEQCVYLPNKGQSVYYEGKKCFNTWIKNVIQPAEGDCSMFEEHIKYLLPNERESGILLDWMAYNIQNQGSKINWAVLLQGDEGTGKSYIGTVMREILGHNNISFPSNDSLKERYTGWQKGCSMVVIEEIMAKGRIDIMNKLKPMITQNIATIRQMRMDEYTQPNVYNMIAYTNHDDSIIISEKDRRYCVLHSPAVERPDSYYKELFDWTFENIPVIYKYLMDRDISGFNAKGRAPHTEAKDSLIETSRSPLENWVRDTVEAGAFPFNRDIITPYHIMKELPRAAAYNMSTAKLGRELKGFGFVSQGRARFDGGQFTIYSCRNHEKWTGCDLEIKIKNLTDGVQPGGSAEETDKAVLDSVAEPM